MKRIVIGIVGVGLLTGIVFALVRSPKPAEPLVEPQTAVEAPATAPEQSSPATEIAQPAKVVPIREERPATRPPNIDAGMVTRAVDLLISPQGTFKQKLEAWHLLRETGKFDQAIADLEQRVANDPRSAELPATLGQAYLKKCGMITDMREQGILAMQADKLFDTSLGLDPSNWEARFTKAVGMSFWPPMLNKGEEVIQNFQVLIEQQESQAPKPEFAESYSWLGDQYQKGGKSDDALAIWKRGAALFPSDEKLRSKLAGVASDGAR